MPVRDICDCHMHILDRRYRLWSGAVLDPEDGLVAEYSQVVEALGIARCVVVGPSIYGPDNSCTRDALGAIGIPAKGIAILTPDSTRADIAELDAAGFVGVRFNFVQGGPWKVEDVAPIARRVADFGWHVQVYAIPSQVAGMDALLQSLPTPIVFDHIARIRDPHGSDAQAFATISKLVDGGRTWVKLSAPYTEPDARGEQTDRFARTVSAFVGAMPERLLWASDWPHGTESPRPDTSELFSDFCSFVGDERLLDRILVDNPKQLYGFD